MRAWGRVMKGIKEAYTTTWGSEKWLTGLSPSWDSLPLPPLSNHLFLIFSLLLPLSASGYRTTSPDHRRTYWWEAGHLAAGAVCSTQRELHKCWLWKFAHHSPSPCQHSQRDCLFPHSLSNQLLLVNPKAWLVQFSYNVSCSRAALVPNRGCVLAALSPPQRKVPAVVPHVSNLLQGKHL